MMKRFIAACYLTTGFFANSWAQEIDFNKVNQVLATEFAPVLLEKMNHDISLLLHDPSKNLAHPSKIEELKISFSKNSNLNEKLDLRINIKLDGTPWNGTSDPVDAKFSLLFNKNKADLLKLQLSLNTKLKTNDLIKSLAQKQQMYFYDLNDKKAFEEAIESIQKNPSLENLNAQLEVILALQEKNDTSSDLSYKINYDNLKNVLNVKYEYRIDYLNTFDRLTFDIQLSEQTTKIKLSTNIKISEEDFNIYSKMLGEYINTLQYTNEEANNLSEESKQIRMAAQMYIEMAANFASEGLAQIID